MGKFDQLENGYVDGYRYPYIPYAYGPYAYGPYPYASPYPYTSPYPYGYPYRAPAYGYPPSGYPPANYPPPAPGSVAVQPGQAESESGGVSFEITPNTAAVYVDGQYSSADWCRQFGWCDRINEPATVNDRNWTYRLPWPVDRLDEIPEARERKDRLRSWSERYGRQ